MLAAMAIVGAIALGETLVDVRAPEQGPLAAHSAELRGYLTEAAENSPALQAAFHRWLASREGIIGAKTLDDPMFTYGYFVQSDMNEYRLALSQKVPWFGTLGLRGESAGKAADAALQEVYAVRNEIFAEVKRAYYAYGFLGESLEVTEAQLEILTHTEEIVRSKYSLGLASEDALLRVGIEMTQVRNEKHRIEDQRPAVSARIVELLGRHDGEVLPWPDLGTVASVQADRSEVLARIQANNPDLKRFDERIAREERNVMLARKRGMPQLNVGMEFKEKTESVSMRDEWMVSLGVSVPVWRKRVRADVEQARLRKRAEEYDRMREEYALERAAAEVLYRVKDSQRRTTLYGESLIPQAEQAYQGLQSAYAAGREDATFLDLLEAVRVLLSFELEAVRAKRDLRIAASDMQWLMGSF